MMSDGREILAPRLIDLGLGVTKASTFGVFLLLFLVLQMLVSLLIWNRRMYLSITVQTVSFFAKIGLRILDIKAERSGHKLSAGSLIISNHLSYVDVLVYAAFYPSLFVTSREILKTPILGQVTFLAGCFFVERRKSRRTLETKKQEIARMRERIDQGFDVFLFPEGTSSDGVSVLPFKATFFQLPIDGKIAITPMCLHYGDHTGIVAWYGTMTFTDHLFNLCLQKNLTATLDVLSAFTPVNHTSHFEVAALSQNLIREAYEQS